MTTLRIKVMDSTLSKDSVVKFKYFENEEWAEKAKENIGNALWDLYKYGVVAYYELDVLEGMVEE